LPHLTLATRSLLLSTLFVAACGASARAQGDAAATPDPAQPAQERVYTRDEVTKPAVIVSMPDPVYYNSGAKLLDLTGTVKVSVVLSSSGRVTNVQVLEGLSKNQNFASLKAARRITFMPAQKDGVPVSQSFVASYGFTTTTQEPGKPDELKGLTKFYVDTDGDRESLGDITDELQKRLPQLVIVDRPDEAECILKFDGYRIRTFSYTGTGRNDGVPITVDSGRAWVIKPVSADKRRVLLYYAGTKAKPFVRGFVYEYKKVNGIDD
jgi:TonB family protein